MFRNTFRSGAAVARRVVSSSVAPGAGSCRFFGAARPLFAATVPTSSASDLTTLKFDSNASQNLYAIFKLHNIPYLVTKGDKVILPVKLKNLQVGDQLVLNNVTTLGSPNFTLNEAQGISPAAYELTANVVEITREPYYEVYRKKPRCRRLKTFPVQNFQTVLLINELRLK